MDISTEDEGFLKDLVKVSRQRIHQIKWVDRDGSQRLTAVNSADFERLNGIARKLKKSAAEIMREAAYIPVNKISKPQDRTPLA